MQCLVYYSLDAFLHYPSLNSSYWWVIHRSQIISITLLIGHFQLELFISQFLMKCFASERIWSHDSDWSVHCVRAGPVPGHRDPPPLSQHCQQNKTDRGLPPGLGRGRSLSRGKECWMPELINSDQLLSGRLLHCPQSPGVLRTLGRKLGHFFQYSSDCQHPAPGIPLHSPVRCPNIYPHQVSI